MPWGRCGAAAGLLSGNSLIGNARSALRSLINFNGSGNTKSLSDLGIELSSSGQMSLNQVTFNALNSSQLSDAFTLLGSTSTGFGFTSPALMKANSSWLFCCFTLTSSPPYSPLLSFRPSLG